MATSDEDVDLEQDDVDLEQDHAQSRQTTNNDDDKPNIEEKNAEMGTCTTDDIEEGELPQESTQDTTNAVAQDVVPKVENNETNDSNGNDESNESNGHEDTGSAMETEQVEPDADTKDNSAKANNHSRKRTRLEMEDMSSSSSPPVPADESHEAQQSNSPASALTAPAEKLHRHCPRDNLPRDPRLHKTKPNPFKNVNWGETDFLFVRLTYFNKRKCRRIPRAVENYETLQTFIVSQFPSLKHCAWHLQVDQDWIEDLHDFVAVRDLFMAQCPQPSVRLQLQWLELMVINESLPNESIYFPKAIYMDNPYADQYAPDAGVAHAHAHASAAPPPPPHVHPHAHPVVAVPPVYVAPPSMPPAHMPPQQHAAPAPAPVAEETGYHHVIYPQYAPPAAAAAAAPLTSMSRPAAEHVHVHQVANGGAKNGLQLLAKEREKELNDVPRGVVYPEPTTYLPFSHAGQSTPQMRTLHKIVWALQHQIQPLSVDSLRKCVPGKKKATIQEIDYLLTSYEKYEYTKSATVNGRKMWTLTPQAFPSEFWNLQWQRP